VKAYPCQYVLLKNGLKKGALETMGLVADAEALVSQRQGGFRRVIILSKE
jgi:hypothetical protein